MCGDQSIQERTWGGCATAVAIAATLLLVTTLGGLWLGSKRLEGKDRASSMKTSTASDLVPIATGNWTQNIVGVPKMAIVCVLKLWKGQTSGRNSKQLTAVAPPYTTPQQQAVIHCLLVWNITRPAQIYQHNQHNPNHQCQASRAHTPRHQPSLLWPPSLCLVLVNATL
jgi:hypothetical protein